MKARTFKEFVYGTVQGVILIAVTYGAGIFVQKRMMKNIFKEEV